MMKTEPNMKDTTQTDPAMAEELDPQSLAAIKALLVEEVPDDPAVIAAAATEAYRKAPEPEPETERRAAQAFPDLAESAPAQPSKKSRFKRAKPARAATKPQRAGSGRMDALKAQITGYRPTPRHILLASAALLIVFRPWLVVGLVLLALMLLGLTFLVLGYDGFWLRAMGAARWYANRNPDRAGELNRKFDTFALKWDAFLDRFPEGTVDGLYLPDLGDIAQRDARHEEVLDRRMQNLRETEV
ncbi:hypothetical protein C8N31_11819 [Sulfitobacter mediterraneus]|uniref:Uncharacterized protein n=2 Tax=Sulfitobacter mediterraneus TaxID=83219 RepID=A0A2T6C2Q6_9RHOB|nr:hypothetical protein C8N31_11819 [Sulfitobacter mediterraneus]